MPDDSCVGLPAGTFMLGAESVASALGRPAGCAMRPSVT